MILLKAKRSFVSGIILISILFLGAAATFTYAIDTCTDCHKDEKFRVQNSVLFDYYNNWKNSTHELAGVKCVDCHGGNPGKGGKDEAHKDDFTSLTAVDKSAYKKIPQQCGQCHEPVLKNFIESKHYKAIQQEGSGPHCATCHGSMNSEVYYTSIVSRVCAGCHNAYTENRPEVVGEAEKILHRINVSRVFKNWVSIYYSDTDPEKVGEMNARYKDIAAAWHTFDFAELNEKSQLLLNQLKSLVNKGIAEKRGMSAPQQ